MKQLDRLLTASDQQLQTLMPLVGCNACDVGPESVKTVPWQSLYMTPSCNNTLTLLGMTVDVLVLFELNLLIELFPFIVANSVINQQL